MRKIAFFIFCLYWLAKRPLQAGHFKGSKTLFLAHRGLTTRHLENSLKALQEAFDVGVDGIEFDVQLSCDLVPMVFHDRSLKRLVGINSTIDDMPAYELKKLRQHGPRYAQDYAISTLEEVLDMMPAQKIINIELKETTIRGLKNIINIISKHKNRLDIIISSFDPQILKNIAEQDKNLCLGLLLDKKLDVKVYMQALSVSSALSYINPHLYLVNAQSAQLLKNLGAELIFWGHKKMGDEGLLVEMGHRAIISDRSHELKEYYRRR